MKPSTHTKPKTGRNSADRPSTKKKGLLFFFALVILLTVGYILYQTAGDSRRNDRTEQLSGAPGQKKMTARKNEQIPPAVTRAKLQLESVNNIDRVRVIILTDKQDDRQGLVHRFEWFKNGQPYGGSDDSIAGVEKDDTIDVRITPFDGAQPGRPANLTMKIAHVTPKIVENKTISFDGNTLSHQVKAVDPEDGTLSYSLVGAPRDMSINSQTGVINWQVKAGEYGKHKVDVMIKSSNGTEVVYPLSIDIDNGNG